MLRLSTNFVKAGAKQFSKSGVLPLYIKRHYTTDFPKIFDVTEENLDQVLASKTPIIIDLHATWCGPCKMLMPQLEKLVSEAKNAKLAKCDVETMQEYLDKMPQEVQPIVSVPTVFALKDGKFLGMFQGCPENSKIAQFVNDVDNA